jgi:hypothetical protein
VSKVTTSTLGTALRMLGSCVPPLTVTTFLPASAPVLDAAVGLDQHLLAGDEGGQRKVDDGLAFLVVGEGCGQQVDMALLQLRNARRHGELLDLQLDAQPGSDGASQVDLIANDFARLRVDEAVGLVGAQHTDHEFTFFLDVVELVGPGGGLRRLASLGSAAAAVNEGLRLCTCGIRAWRGFHVRGAAGRSGQPKKQQAAPARPRRGGMGRARLFQSALAVLYEITVKCLHALEWHRRPWPNGAAPVPCPCWMEKP